VIALNAVLSITTAGRSAAQIPTPEPSPTVTAQPSPPPAQPSPPPAQPSPPPSEEPAPPPQPPDPPTTEAGGQGGQTGAVTSNGSSGQQQSRGRDRGGRPGHVDPCAALVGVAGPDSGGPGSTALLEKILDRSTSSFIRDAFLRVAGPFPVAGPAWWTNDWHARRCEPYPHLHKGLDIFAEEGTPVVAAADGRVSQSTNHSIAGLSVEITDGAGVQYFYAHLTRIAAGISVGDRIETGHVLGYVGATGNASGGPPHLHLEVQPGGVPVPPKPFVDRWLEVAERRAGRMVRRQDDGVLSTHLARLLPEAEVVGVPALEPLRLALFPSDPRGTNGADLGPTRAVALSLVAVAVLVGLIIERTAGRRRRLAWRQLTQAVSLSPTESRDLAPEFERRARTPDPFLVGR
jgi:murein DD-endopeptidase MepM/ murein hydrolase activator NlpD